MGSTPSMVTPVLPPVMDASPLRTYLVVYPTLDRSSSILAGILVATTNLSVFPNPLKIAPKAINPSPIY